MNDLTPLPERDEQLTAQLPGCLGSTEPPVDLPDFVGHTGSLALLGAPLRKPDEPPPSQPRVADFVLEEELGRGGMGVVYKARQLPLNRVVALKMILAGDHAHATAKARFLAEAEAIAKVRHPGIVQVYAYGTHQGHPYFALEYVEGGSLDHLLGHRPIPPNDAARLVAELADAVQAAHDQGIIHRDLKPANILLAQKIANSKRQFTNKSERTKPKEGRDGCF